MSINYKKIYSLVPESVKDLLEYFNEANYSAYLVGGYVRDLLLSTYKSKFKNLSPSDIDVTTSATPDEIKRVLQEHNLPVYPMGEKLGTITTKINHRFIDITTFRTESNYSDSRHPDSVKFVSSIEQDLARRDFTINAIALNKGGFVDPFGGIKDLINKDSILRAVGNAKERFMEDPLRILRAIRFHTIKGITDKVDKSTENAMFECKKELLNIAPERLAYEFKNILCPEYDYSERIKEALINYKDIVAVFIPEIIPTFGFNQHSKYHDLDCWEHIVEVVGNASDLASSPWVRIAAFFHDIGKPESFTLENGEGHFYGHPERSAEITKEILERLRFSNFDIKFITTLVKYHDYNFTGTEKNTKKLLIKLMEEYNQTELMIIWPVFKDIVTLYKADSLAHNKKYVDTTAIDKQLNNFNNIKEKDEALSIAGLEITGHDIKQLGIKEGPEIGRILNDCLKEVLAENLENNYEVLIKYVSEWIEKEGVNYE